MCREEFQSSHFRPALGGEVFPNQAEEAGYSLAPGRVPEGEIIFLHANTGPSILFKFFLSLCLKHGQEETPGFQKRNLESIESEPGVDFLPHILDLIEGP